MACPFAPRSSETRDQQVAAAAPSSSAGSRSGQDIAGRNSGVTRSAELDEARREAEAGAQDEAAEVTAAPAPVKATERTFPPYAGHPEDGEPPAVPLEGIRGLDYYYSQLTLTELGEKGAITRASQWGDSVIGGDGLTEAMRQRLQRRFGDAGHGFHALGKYSRWYSHHGVYFNERRDWKTCLIIFKCESDRRFGFGGVTSTSRGGAQSVWRTVAEDFGSKVSRFELWYQKRPDGGGFEIRVDGDVQRLVDARAPEVSDAVETVLMPDGPHEISVTALATGVARGYGVVLERDVPGAVWDELSLIGSFTQRLDYQDGEHIAGQVRRRDVDLLVFMFGGNDLGREGSDLKHTMQPYEEEYARMIRKMRAGKPEASCLIMSLTDHAKRVNGVIVSRAIMPRMVEAQRKVALAEGCAFFDTYMAMGGSRGIELGRRAKPPLAAPDLRHPTKAGQRKIAELLYGALMHGYADYRRRQSGRPLPAPAE